MKQYKPSYFIGQAFRGIWRNGVMSFASIAVLMSCLVVLGSFALLVMNINENLNDLGLMNEVMVFLEFDLTEEQIQNVEREIKSIPGVGDVERITADEGIRSMMEKAGENAYLYEDFLDDNPLSDSFRLTYVDGAKLIDIEYNLRHIGPEIRLVRDQRDLAATMQSLKNGIMLIFSWFLIVLFIVSVFVIINTVKLSVYSRKSEIIIMRYVGATGLFISLPFIIEGALIGLVASVISFLAENFLYGYIQTALADLTGIISIVPIETIRIPMLLAFIAVGVLTGIVGSTISLSKYTRE